MRALYMDIETLRSIKMPPLDLDSVKVPANYTKPDTIAKYRMEKAIEEQRKTWKKSSLDPMAGTLACVGAGMTGCTSCWPEPGFVLQPGTEGIHPQLRWEAAVLDHLERDLTDAVDMNGGVEIVTWNGEEFDIPFLLKRALFHRRYNLVSMIRRAPKRDLRRLWAMGGWHRNVEGKLREVARFLGWDGPDDIPGDKVYEHFAVGDYATVRVHCMSDVEATQHIGRVLSECGFWTEGT